MIQHASTSRSNIRKSFTDRQIDASTHALSKDDLFHVLSNRRRRDILRYLADHDGINDVGKLASQVAAWEKETTVQRLTSKERKPVYIALYQNHLPKLEDHGLIEYDKSRGCVSRTDQADQCNQYLWDEKTDKCEPHDTGTDTPEIEAKGLHAGRAGGTTMLGVVVLTLGWLELVPSLLLLVLTWIAITALCLVPILENTRIDGRLAMRKWRLMNRFN